MDPWLKIIAQGGTAGLILALIAGLMILARGRLVPRDMYDAVVVKLNEREDMLFRLAGITERTVTATREFVQAVPKITDSTQERLDVIEEQVNAIHEAVTAERRTKPRRAPMSEGGGR